MTNLGKYELLEQLGEGATSEVYRARDATLGREVALKVLKPALVADSSAFERFAREAQAAAGLFHPNIATVLDMGAADGRYFIAMRYFPGQSLDKIIKNGPLSWAETLQLAQQIGSALDFAHAQGFLHRDVKPANILRAQDGTFILTDFGLTRAMLSTNLTSHTGAVLGTPAYIAPEIWNGEPAVPATDQYAMACVICEALTGHALFTGNTPPAIMTQHVLKGPEIPTTWQPGVPPGVGAVLRRAFSAQPANRYQNLAALNVDLQALAGFRSAPQPQPQIQPQPQPQLQPKPQPQLQPKPQPQLQPKPQPQPQPQPQPRPVEKVPTSNTSRILQMAAIGMLALVCLALLAGGVIWLAANRVAAANQALALTQVSSTLQAATLTPIPTHIPPTITPTATVAATATKIVMREQDGMVMLYVPEGPFTMGSDKVDNEKPVHTVTLDAFWIDKTEVTNDMFKVFIQANHYRTDAEKAGQAFYLNLSSKKWEALRGANWQHPQGPNSNLTGLSNHPVAQISWKDAKAYCEWAGARLPTEAEWEKAARGSDGRTYPWGETAPNGTLLNFADANLAVNWADKRTNDGYQFTGQVGSYPAGASPYGALDMSGNLWEWVADWYDETYYQNSPTSNPTGPASGDSHVLRGGSWDDLDSGVRSTFRAMNGPNIPDDAYGFRCARSQ